MIRLMKKSLCKNNIIESPLLTINTQIRIIGIIILKPVVKLTLLPDLTHFTHRTV